MPYVCIRAGLHGFQGVSVRSLPKRGFTGRTLMEMHRLALRARMDPDFQALAARIVSECRPRDYRCEVRKLWNWVRSRVRYVQDPLDVELVQSPRRTIERAAGDCDDLATLLAALASTLGHRYRFSIVKADRTRPDEWSHVWVEVKPSGSDEWIAMDASVPSATLGWKPKRYWEIMHSEVPDAEEIHDERV